MKSWRRTLWNLAGGLSVVFLAALPALAAEAAEQDPAESPTGWIFRWLNFLIVFGGIGYVLAKNGPAFFRANAKAIAANIHEAQAEKSQAESELRDAEAKIQGLNQEVAALREAAGIESAAEAERLRASGRVEIEKINQAAHEELLSSERFARQRLRTLAATMAVDRAGILLASQLDAELRAKMLQSFANELAGSAN